MLKKDAVPLEERMTQCHIHTISTDEETEGRSSRLACTNVSSERSLSSNGSSRVPLMHDHGTASTLTTVCSSRTQRHDLQSSGNLTINSDGSTYPSSPNYSPLINNGSDCDEEEMRWQSVQRHLQMNIEGNSQRGKLWRNVAMGLYDKIEDWRQEKMIKHKSHVFDCGVICTTDEIDREIMEEFLRYLDLEGIVAVSVIQVGIGQDMFEVSEKILNGSSFIFILKSLPFLNSGFHRLLFKESLQKKIHFDEWKHKLIPLIPSQRDVLRYRNKYPLLGYLSGRSILFGLSSIQGIHLGDRTETINQVRQVLTTDIQSMNDQKRRREKKQYLESMSFLKKLKCDELREGLSAFKDRFERLSYSTGYLAQLCMENENLYSLSPIEGPDQVITLDNCSEISFGPSFHFNIGEAFIDPV